MGKPEREPAGLKSIRESRQNRGRLNRITPQHLLFVLLTCGTVLLVYRFVSGHNLDVAKDKLLQKQRAVAATVGAEWTPLQSKLEKMTLDAATSFKGDFVDSEAARFEFRSAPGIYLRMRVVDAKDTASLRRAARASMRDSFVGCFLREPLNPAALKGIPDAGVFPDQPWNLRQGYAATRILSEDWVREIKDSDDDLRLRVFEQQYEKAIRNEIPLALDMIKKAQFFLLVLDEDTDAAKEAADGGPLTLEALQLVPHDARVPISTPKTRNELFRLKRVVDPTFYMAGDRAAVDPETEAAMRRNINNCDLANKVQAALDEKK